jgi:hypothetical protein
MMPPTDQPTHPVPSAAHHRLRRAGLVGALLAAGLIAVVQPAAALTTPELALNSDSPVGTDREPLSWRVRCAKTPIPVNLAPNARTQPAGTTKIRSSRLPGGGRTNVWTYQTLARGHRTTGYLAITTLPVGSGRYQPDVLNRGVTSFAPLRDLTPNPRTVAAVNGDYWDLNSNSILRGAQVVRGHIVKAYRTPRDVVGMTRHNRMARSSVSVEGSVAVGRRHLRLESINGHAIVGGGVNVYTSWWGRGPRPFPTGTVEVLAERVGDKTVVRQVARSARARTGKLRWTVPTRHIVLAARGAAGAALAQLRPGRHVDVTYRGRWSGGSALYSAIGQGLTLVSGARDALGRCTQSTERVVPRTMIAWRDGGRTALLITANSGFRTRDGSRSGGASVWTMTDAAIRAGATDAVFVDGGASTTMLIRTSTRRGTAPYRVDLPRNSRQRTIVNGLGFTVR